MMSRRPSCAAASIGVSFHGARAFTRAGWRSTSSRTLSRSPCALPTHSSTMDCSRSALIGLTSIVISIAKYMTERTAERLHSIALHLIRGLRRQDDELGVGPARLSAPKTMSELAAAEQVRLPTMTRIVSGLAGLGLVRRLPHPTDRRSVRVEMTEAGAETIGRGRTLRVERLARSLQALDEAELARVEGALEVLER